MHQPNTSACPNPTMYISQFLNTFLEDFLIGNSSTLSSKVSYKDLYSVLKTNPLYDTLEDMVEE